MSKDEIIDLQIRLSEVTHLAEELSSIVADQAKRIELLEKRAQFLLERAREAEEATTGSVVIGDQPPPHY